MRVLVCGGRNFSDRGAVAVALSPYRPKSVLDVAETIFILGGARGADTLAEIWADLWGVRKRVFLADWNNLSHPDARIKTRADGSKYDANAGLRRNQRMLDEGKPELVIAFKGATGTADMIARAKRAGIEVIEIARRKT